MKGEPVQYSCKMNLTEESPVALEHVAGKRELADQFEEKSCNSRFGKKMKLQHQRLSSGGAAGFGDRSSSPDADSDDSLKPFNLDKPAVRATLSAANSSSKGEKLSADKIESAKESSRAELEDDSSSTSSCSCEQHSNGGQEEECDDDDDEFHEKLDYDDDSITNSPMAPSAPSTRAPVSSIIQPSSATTTVKENESHTKLDSMQGKHLDHSSETPTSIETKAPSSPSSDLRLKSVINLSHKSAPNKSDGTNRVSSDRSSRSYHSLLRYLFKDACFFQMKSINHENIKISKSMGIWSTPIPNEVRLNLAFKEHRNVILIFSVQQSGGFQGFARMVSESEPPTRPLPWILPERLSSRSLRGAFKVQWLCKKELPFHQAQELYNPYNDNKPVKVARDGQQVESKIGKKLCKLFPEDDKDRLLASISLMRRQVSQRKEYPNKYAGSYPHAYRHDSDGWRRDPHTSSPFYHNDHSHDDYRRPYEHHYFNHHSAEPESSPSFQNYSSRHPVGVFNHPRFDAALSPHHQSDQRNQPSIWAMKPPLDRRVARDYRPKR